LVLFSCHICGQATLAACQVFTGEETLQSNINNSTLLIVIAKAPRPTWQPKATCCGPTPKHQKCVLPCFLILFFFHLQHILVFKRQWKLGVKASIKLVWILSAVSFSPIYFSVVRFYGVINEPFSPA